MRAAADHESHLNLRGLRRRLLAGMVAASVVTTAGIITYYQLIGRPDPDRSRLSIVVQNVIVGAAAIAVGALIGHLRLSRRLEPEWRTVIAGGAGDDGVRERVVRQPARTAAFVLAMWLVPAFASPVDDVVDGEAKAAAAEFVGILLGSLANAALVYLLVERSMRPLFDMVLRRRRAGPVAGRSPGVRERFLVAWALGSAIPLAGIAATPLVKTGPLPAVVAMTFLAVVGLGTGLVMTIVVAQSVAEPLASVIDAMARVEAGDLSVVVATDDAGDIGRLQAGLNHMAAGLAERARLADLFGRHVGVDVARAALGRGIELGGELREATILFVDLVGSTAVASNVSPTEVVAMANRLFEEVVAAVAEHGGWVNKFQGDGAMCVFGAPLALAGVAGLGDEHEPAGLRAAAQLGRRLRSRGIDAAIGVASGEVVAGNVGTEERFEYTVMGATVNMAARLCEAAKSCEGRVLGAGASARVYAACGWRSVGELELRGFSSSVPAWEPAGAAAA